MDATHGGLVDLEPEAPHPSLPRKGKKNKGKAARGASAPPVIPFAAVSFTPKTFGQARLQAALRDDRLVFATGPAGTGKTLFAVSRAVDLLLEGNVERIALTRPAVEAGERIGFLPGNAREKLDPYLRPLYDAIGEKLGDVATGTRTIDEWIRSGRLEIAPLGFLRGRTLRKTALVADEMQNATYTQIKMVLTRIGEGSHFFVTGDLGQVDLPLGASGLAETLDKVERHGKYPVVRLLAGDIQRDPVCKDIVSIL